jgi:hypothetical protein
VVVLQHVAIGKESNRVKLVAAEESDGVVDGDEAGLDGAQEYTRSGIGEVLQRYSVADLARAAGLSRQTLHDLRRGKTTAPSKKTLAAIMRGLVTLEAEHKQGHKVEATRAADGQKRLPGDVCALLLA